MTTSKRARSIAVLVSLAVIAGSGVARAGTVPIKIATWNLEWLNAQSNTGHVERNNADYARLKGYANRLDADVIAFQEVDGEAAAKRVFDPAMYAFHFEGRFDVQRVGFAWKKSLAGRGVTVTPEPDLFALSINDIVRRGARIGLATDAAQLHLMSVHLKSGCWDAALDSGGDACPKLAQQVPILESWIDQQASSAAPFVVLGDFNRRFTPSEEFWVEIDDGDPENADLSRITEGRTSGCWAGEFPGYIDHIVFDRQSAQWRDQATFQQLAYDAGDAQFKSKLSDHCPLAVEVRMPIGGAGPGPIPTPTPIPGLTLEGLDERVRRIEQQLGLPPM